MNITKDSYLNQFQNLQRIGQGLTSTVYKATHPEMKQVCLKVIDPKFYSKPIGKLLIDNEIHVLKSLNHKNLLKLRKHKQSQQQNIIITDFCEGGNLYDLTKKCSKFKQEQTLIIFQGIINGLLQLNKKNIIHRDLKPQNIFFNKGEPIIADFGFAVHENNKTLNKVNAGSPLYMSPQALQNLDFSFQSDVFSIGVMIFQMLKGKTPWVGGSQAELLKNILAFKPSIQLANKKFQDLIIKCLQPKKQNRAKFIQVSDFFKDWKNQRFNKVGFLYDVKNIKQIKEQSKDKKSCKLLKLNLKQKSGKENVLNQTVSHIKTHRQSVQPISRYRNISIMLDADGMKTRRNKSEKLDQDLRIILARLDPGQMKFLPSSMIEKFKFILECYSRVIESKQSAKQKDIPKSLQSDKAALEIAKSKDQKQLCQSISNYVGRMYRLAKNYNVYQDFIKDIEVLYLRVESFC